MNLLLALSGRVDRLTERLGRALPWLVLAMTLLGAGNAVARYLGRQVGRTLTSNALIELQWYLFSALFLLGAAVVLQKGAHVRVDVIQSRLSDKGKRRLDCVGALVFLLPFALFGLVVSLPMAWRSLLDRELSADPGGLPRYPVKALIVMGFAWLLIQGLSELVKSVAALRRGGKATEEAVEETP